MPAYTYTSSIDFINDLSFDHIETYSFQRGPQFEERKRLNHLEYSRLDTRKNIFDDLTAQEEKRLDELEQLAKTQYLLNEEGHFHSGCIMTNRFSINDPQVARLKDILLTKITEIPMWLCSPMYRDAVVFYNKAHEIVATLNVCLSCSYMETQMFHYINADHTTYELLREFFTSIGHEVEADI
ncbi:hypothetical protein [Ferruginibacter sp.]